MGQARADTTDRAPGIPSPLRTLLLTVLIVFVCESIVMMLIGDRSLPHWVLIVLDPILLAILSTPLMMATLLRPMQRSLAAQLRAKSEAQAASAAARAADAAKTRFLSHMSHEFRTPLNGVIGMAGLLRETPLAPDQDEYVTTLSTCSGQLLTLVNDVLDLAKIEAGKLELDREAFRIGRILEEATTIVRANESHRDIDFSCRIADEVPAAVYGDPLRLRQILINLLNNAAKYTRGNRVEVFAFASAPAEHGVQIRFEVIDDGEGIPDDRMDDLFADFSQVRSDNGRTTVGTGLGLSISRHLCELMGGDIGASSNPGHGSVFWFTVQLEPAAVADGAPDPSAGPGDDKEPLGLRVLLVDDNPVNLRLGFLVLTRNLGCEVDTAENGLLAIGKLQQGDYDAVLMDCEMPVMDGLEATRTIRSPDGGVRNPGIPVIALTARAFDHDLQECLDAGMCEVIPKPLDQLALRTALARVPTMRSPSLTA